MGLLVDGQWKDRWYDTESTGGEFVREQSQCRQWVVGDGMIPPNDRKVRPAEANRYHLYVSLACPWAHRILIMHRLKGLEDLIGVSVTSPYMGENGWSYDQTQGSTGDAINGVDFHRELYIKSDPNYTGRVTVPVLWDKKAGDIVNNESAELMRILNDAFDQLTGNSLNLYPPGLQAQIDDANEQVYDTVNNGVYKAGFATEQSVYEKHVSALFKTLDDLETRLDRQRYLVGAYLTEADIRLFTTLIRFDAVYHGHFKCNIRRIEDYPNLSNYLRELYQWPGIADTVDFDHIKRHYYQSHPTVNPNGIVPLGPALELTREHDRARLPGKGIMQ
ncbi:glutathione S-transferase family protein [Larsenimonas suaedae]|uniref:Glutathione S-transferase family protein n=1 Tax=Larsenimonas suaedae TaxID=1851019 RepID=A0ABU1GTH6_9GAMM|nr:glutathione S-transferase family protein [Larsenimonas suaedae]MCM2971732.1 glutathione S-transferase family protein [Larsenimonas suaedae]MDR5895284.1 glutathione S-transferase family protein [Larsenimonas suaedae]